MADKMTCRTFPTAFKLATTRRRRDPASRRSTSSLDGEIGPDSSAWPNLSRSRTAELETASELHDMTSARFSPHATAPAAH